TARTVTAFLATTETLAMANMRLAATTLPVVLKHLRIWSSNKFLTYELLDVVASLLGHRRVILEALTPSRDAGASRTPRLVAELLALPRDHYICPGLFRILERLGRLTPAL